MPPLLPHSLTQTATTSLTLPYFPIPSTTSKCSIIPSKSYTFWHTTTRSSLSHSLKLSKICFADPFNQPVMHLLLPLLTSITFGPPNSVSVTGISYPLHYRLGHLRQPPPPSETSRDSSPCSCRIILASPSFPASLPHQLDLGKQTILLPPYLSTLPPLLDRSCSISYTSPDTRRYQLKVRLL